MHPRRAAAIAIAIAVAATPARADAPPTAATPGRVQRIEHTPLDDAPTRGPHDAPVTVEIFFSPGNELSHQAYRRALALWRRHPARVRLIFRPLKRSDASEYVAPLVVALHGRGRFFAAMDDLVGRTGPQISHDAMNELAAQLGLDRPAADAAAKDADIEAVLDANKRRAVRARIGQGAELVLNRRPLGPTPDDATLEAAYATALALARIERAAGAPTDALPALAARRRRCDDIRDHMRPRRRHAAVPDDEVAPRAEEASPPITGWHLGALLRDGTGCAPDTVPTGRVDDSFDTARTDQPARPLLLAAPLAATGLPTCGPPEAPVVIEVICAPRNATCADQLLRARRVAIDYVPSVRVVFRPWVDLASGDADLELTVAQTVMCSQRFGDGWRFAIETRGQALVPALLTRAAEVAGITGADATTAFLACADGATEAARHAIDDARAAGLAWAPTVIVGGRAYVGGFTDDRWLKDLVDAELAPGLLGANSDVASAADPAPATAVNTCE